MGDADSDAGSGGDGKNDGNGVGGEYRLISIYPPPPFCSCRPCRMPQGQPHPIRKRPATVLAPQQQSQLAPLQLGQAPWPCQQLALRPPPQPACPPPCRGCPAASRPPCSCYPGCWLRRGRPMRSRPPMSRTASRQSPSPSSCRCGRCGRRGRCGRCVRAAYVRGFVGGRQTWGGRPGLRCEDR